MIDKVLLKIFDYAKQKSTRTRVVLVYNPRSTEATRINTEVVNPIREAIVSSTNSGHITFLKYEIKPTTVDDNAESLANILIDGDVVVAAGGDATATISINAIMLSKGTAQFEALPYGNFSDTAKMCEMADKLNLKKLYPIMATVNGKFYRYAACYFTIGMMAESTEIFDIDKIRKHLRNHKNNTIYSLRKLASWYFKNRKRDFIPTKRFSDIFIVNSPRVAKMMKGGNFYNEKEQFLVIKKELTKFGKLLPFMTTSIFKSIPGNIESQLDIAFEKPTSLEIQAEGEYKKFNNVVSLRFEKTKKFINLL